MIFENKAVSRLLHHLKEHELTLHQYGFLQVRFANKMLIKASGINIVDKLELGCTAKLNFCTSVRLLTDLTMKYNSKN